ncbi:DExH-box ATP-dependent RNA helicase DExH10 [Bienertia sinuspersici]
MRESQLQKFRDELKNWSCVLKKLGHFDTDGVVQLKGRAAALIETLAMNFFKTSDMGIEEKEIAELVSQIEELEQILLSHPVHKSEDVHQVKSFQRKAEVNHEIQQLKSKMRESQSRKKLGHIDANGVVQLKGRAAALIDTGHELLVTELMFNVIMEMNSLRDMVLGKPTPLLCTFRLSYYSILNLMCRAEGQFAVEHVIQKSFHQFQHEKALPEIGNKIEKLE